MDTTTKLKKPTIDWLAFIESIQGIAQTGIAYAKDEYDKERYSQILELVAGKFGEIIDVPNHQVKATLFNEIGYATPKICVRAFILNEQKQILFVKERQEGVWSLPGGWADINHSPAESLMKEVKEETGYDCEVKKLLSFWDKQKHEHPRHWPHTYLAFYYCEITGGQPELSHEISDIQFLNIDNLSDLSTHRVTQAQLETLMQIYINHEPTHFD